MVLANVKVGLAAEEVAVGPEPNFQNEPVKLDEVFVKLTGMGGQPSVGVATKLAVGFTLIVTICVMESIQKADCVMRVTV